MVSLFSTKLKFGSVSHYIINWSFCVALNFQIDIDPNYRQLVYQQSKNMIFQKHSTVFLDDH